MSQANAPSPIILQYEPVRPGKPLHWGKGFLSACASLPLWGLGHGIAGQRRAAVKWLFAWIVMNVAMAATMSVPALARGLFPFMLAKAIMVLAVLIVSFRVGRRSEFSGMLSSPLARYAVGLLFVALAWGESLGLRLLLKQGLAEDTVFMSKSMQPTVRQYELVCLSLLPFKPERGDVVAYEMPTRSDPLPQRTLTRIMGLPGETVEIINGHVTVNGESLPNPAGVVLYDSTGANMGPGTRDHAIHLGRDEYYILSDNTRVAFDSRYNAFVYLDHQPGALPRDKIRGLATAILWPPLRASLLR